MNSLKDSKSVSYEALTPPGATEAEAHDGPQVGPNNKIIDSVLRASANSSFSTSLPLTPPKTGSKSHTKPLLSGPSATTAEAEAELIEARNAVPLIPLDEAGEYIPSSTDSDSDPDLDELASSIVIPSKFKTPKKDIATKAHIVPGNYVHRHHIRVAVIPTPFALSVVTGVNYTKNARKRIRRRERNLDTTEHKNPYAWIHGDEAFGPCPSASGESPFIRLTGVETFDTVAEAGEVASDFLQGNQNSSLLDAASSISRNILDRHEAKRLKNRLSAMGKDGVFRGWIEREDGCHVYVKTAREVATLKRRREPSFDGQEIFLVFEQRALPKPEAAATTAGVGSSSASSSRGKSSSSTNANSGSNTGGTSTAPPPPSPPPGTMSPSYITVPIQISSYTSPHAANLCAISYFREVTRPSNQRIEDNTFYSHDLCRQLNQLTYEGLPAEPIDLVFEAWKYPTYNYPFRWLRVSVSRGWLQGPGKLEREVEEEEVERRRLRKKRTKAKQLRLLKEREERVEERERQLGEKEKDIERREDTFRVRNANGDVVLTYHL